MGTITQNAVHGATILTADADGIKSEIVYGIS